MAAIQVGGVGCLHGLRPAIGICSQIQRCSRRCSRRCRQGLVWRRVGKQGGGGVGAAVVLVGRAVRLLRVVRPVRIMRLVRMLTR